MKLDKLDEAMRRARDLQARMEAARASAHAATATGESGGGLVKVTLNGRYEARGVDIEEAALREERAVLEDLIAAAINDAAHRVADMHEERMAAVAREIGVPPGLSLPF